MTDRRRCLGLVAVLAGAALVNACADDAVVENDTTSTTGVGGAGGETTVTVGGGGGVGGVELVEEDPYEAPPDVEPLPADAVTDLGSAIDGVLSTVSGQSHSILIVGAETGQVIYERDPDVVRKPASNTKLFASAAAMVALGEQHRAETVVYATAAPSGGVIDGDLVLLGQHDFTWSTQFYADPAFPLDEIAAELAAAGITQVTGSAQVRGEFLFDGYNFGTYNAAAERAVVAGEFASALAGVGISIGSTSSSPEMAPPDNATELYRWRALPQDVAFSPVNRISHNEFADISSRHLGWTADGDNSYAGGEARMVGLLDEAGADTAEVVFNDGSGLSHGNRVSARHVVQLMAHMEAQPEGLAWERTFSIAGVHGTIGGRLGGPDTLGRFFGKTGTLSDTIALSGVLEHRHDGQRYHIGMLMNGVTSSATARSVHNQIVSLVAADLRGESDVPPAPVLASVESDGNGQSVTAAWSGVDDVDGYLVWRSRDGRVWPRQEARYVTPTSHRTLPIEGDDALYVRVTAVRGIFESEPSDVYAARVSMGMPDVVLVDGNDRWQADPAPENPRGEGHDFIARYAEAMGARSFSSCANEAVLDGGCTLDAQSILVWSLGEESTDHVAVSAEEQAVIVAHTEAGGSLLISGAELGYQLAEDMSDLAFLEDVLRAGYVGDDAGTFSVRGATAEVSSSQVLSFLTPDRMVVRYPDLLQPINGSEPVFDYVGGVSGVAGVQYAGDYRVVTLGFPVESIDDAADRAAMLGAMLTFLQ